MAYDLWLLVRHRLRERSGRHAEDIRVTTHALLDEIVRVARQAGAHPILAYLPVAGEISTDEELTDDERFFFDYCATNPDADCLSTRPGFAARIRQGQEFNTVGHWGPPGHRTVAEVLRDHLRDRAALAPPETGP